MKILVIYYTKTGHTLEAISPFVESIKLEGADVEVVLTKDFKSEMISDFDALVVGTPCWGGSSGFTGVAGPIVRAIKKMPQDGLKNKFCAGIAVHAKYGGKATLLHLEKVLAEKGCENFTRGPIVKAGTLGSIFKGKSVTNADEDLIRIFGKEFFKKVVR